MPSVGTLDLGSGGDLGATILLVTTIPNNYSGMLPSLFTISSPFFHDQEAREGNVRRIRIGEAIATAISLAEAWAVYKLTGSWLPVIGTIVMSALLIVAYEWSLRNPATEDRPKGLL